LTLEFFLKFRIDLKQRFGMVLFPSMILLSRTVDQIGWFMLNRSSRRNTPSWFSRTPRKCLPYLDEAIRDWDQAHRANPSDTFAKEIAPLGTTYSLGALGAFYLAGAIWDKPKARAVAQDGLAASLITSVMIIPAMKFTFGRSRPHEEHGAKDFDVFNINKSSFPSGHTAQAYTVAAAVAAHYDSWWIKGASYGAASLVGWARVHQDRHFTSDCVAGAVIGTFVGHTVARYNQRHRAKAGARKTTLTPFYDGQATGLAIDYKF
jgi:hypothetical protein